MTGQEITPEIRTALGMARAAMEGEASPHGPATTIVLALASAGLIQSPERAAELDRLRRQCAVLAEGTEAAAAGRAALCARLSAAVPTFTALSVQVCTAGQHRPWIADTTDATPVPCPWCEVARAQAVVDGAEITEHYRVEREGVPLATYGTQAAAEAHAEDALRTVLPGAPVEWIADPAEPGVLTLITRHRGHTSATGMTVTLVEVLPAYVPAVTT